MYELESRTDMLIVGTYILFSLRSMYFESINLLKYAHMGKGRGEIWIHFEKWKKIFEMVLFCQNLLTFHWASKRLKYFCDPVSKGLIYL